MPQYLAPGVYVEEVPSSVQPIAGVGTSTAGFIGQVTGVDMPMQPGKFVSDSAGLPIKDSLGNLTPIPFDLADDGKPYLITSWESFKNRFGDFQEGNRVLAHAVYGFFNNGGTRCFVARIEDALDADNVGDVLALFAGIDDIALVAVPGATDAEIQNAVIDHCENTGDRFAILDGQETDTIDPDEIRDDTRTSTYAAMYYPRIEVFDPVDKERTFVPPSGHIAGIFARIDTERGVHKAPANAVVRGALGLEHRLSRADQEVLNPDGINVIRELNGNIVLWGARTLGGDANGEWKYINVRRLFLFLRESIDEGTQWVVFEPNDTALWAKISRNVTAFLTNVWRSGALFGTSPAEAFYVRCDASTNPPELRDLGQVVTEIGVAVVRPAEFVIFRLSQFAGPGK